MLSQLDQSVFYPHELELLQRVERIEPNSDEARNAASYLVQTFKGGLQEEEQLLLSCRYRSYPRI